MKDKNDLITFRLKRADEAFEVAKISLNKSFWNTVAGELYYTEFYLILALFAKYELDVSTHSGVKTVFGSEFIKKGIIDPKWGRHFNILFSKSQQGDYEDFSELTEEEMLPLFKEVEEFKLVIKKLLEQ